MSTSDKIEIGDVKDWVKYCCEQNILFPIDPLVPSAIVRRLFVTKEIMEMLNGPWQDQASEEEWGSVRAVMDAFVTGSLISIAKNKKSGKPKHHMGFLDPEAQGIWDLRAVKPKPGIRILGQFAEKDFFVALAWEKRILLGCYMSPEWIFIMKRCEHKWREIFKIFLPLKGGVPDDYLSNIIVQ